MRETGGLWNEGERENACGTRIINQERKGETGAADLMRS